MDAEPVPAAQPEAAPAMNKDRLRVLIIGATVVHFLLLGAAPAFSTAGQGATGRPLVLGLCKQPDSVVERITVLVRKQTDAFSDPRVRQVITDFDNLAGVQAEFAGHNCIASTFGTTKDQAGTADNYRKLEVLIPNKFADMAKEAGVQHAALMSSQGADPTSFFTYLKQKGEVEQHWKELSFRSLQILKPGLLERGDQMRTGEKVLAWIQKPIPTTVVAGAIITRLCNVVSTAGEGKVTQENAAIYQQAAMPLAVPLDGLPQAKQ